ncbi:rfbP protein [Vibrio cholerae]|nr:rfbP protein [Vibrio cholerae]EGQ9463952.1 rfbP protein [Vibrio cholerae]EGR0190318.1 rfbP protein [Vibrio cholerae]EGR0357849.1 rfbP protein [Vibrio cholerae]EGR0679953.1 rfbP protein [Vibrio cholerae]
MKKQSHRTLLFIVIPKLPLLAVTIVPRGFCPKMRPC